MNIKEKLRPILGVVLLVLLGHFSSVDGCSGSSKESETDNPATEPPAKDCPEHVCNDNKKCYTHDQQCDGNQDCDDNTDEDAGHCDKGMPTFENATCADVTTDAKWDLCIKVTYPNDKTVDYMLLEDGHGWLTYKGEMKDEKVPIAFSWPDEEDGETNATARFHSMHVATCVDYHIDLTGEGATGNSDCIQDHPNGDSVDGTNPGGDILDNSTIAGSPMTSEKRGELHRAGYEMNLDVYFDDDMKDVYGSAAKAKGKLQKVMTYVQEIYEERDTLQTIIKMKINVEHKSGQRWAGPMASFSRNQGNRGVWTTMGNLASSGDAHLYAFVTSNKGAVMGGWAGVGKLCNPRKSERTSISRYSKGRVTWTSELIAHELGHNFGMHHDFKRSPSDVRRDKSGKACYGYMDYKQDTNYWSTCSVEFLTNQNKSCLKKIGGGTTPDQPPVGCEDNKSYAKNCKKFAWACKDSRYPWFRNTCKSTCNNC